MHCWRSSGGESFHSNLWSHAPCRMAACIPHQKLLFASSACSRFRGSCRNCLHAGISPPMSAHWSLSTQIATDPRPCWIKYDMTDFVLSSGRTETNSCRRRSTGFTTARMAYPTTLLTQRSKLYPLILTGTKWHRSEMVLRRGRFLQRSCFDIVCCANN